jgi:endonuclease III
MTSPDGTSTERVRAVVEGLVREHGLPSLNNKTDPFDELVFIVLSLMTTAPSYERVYARLKAELSDWELLRTIEHNELAAIIADAGLSDRKAAVLRGCAQQTHTEFGRVTLDPLREFSAAEAEEWLVALPGVGRKTAKCVVLFALGHDVLPVDTHVRRLATRLELLDEPATSDPHIALEAVVPPGLRRAFHVTAIAHGRAVCRARRPRCEACCIRSLCPQ